ncbi:MAG: hypothetical protein MJY52_02220 [Bacteroidaceae bacterium]|nr:hypothetical protein [Bacteroidaceae bacterium]
MKKFYTKLALVLLASVLCLNVNAQLKFRNASPKLKASVCNVAKVPTFKPDFRDGTMAEKNQSTRMKSAVKKADSDYTDWIPWKDGTCNYTSNLFGEQTGLSISYRESKTNPTTDAEFKISGFGENNINLIIEYNPTTDSCKVLPQTYGKTAGYESYGSVTVTDIAYFVGEDQEYRNEYPCTYNKDFGTFNLTLWYRVAAGNIVAGKVDVCVVDGCTPPYTEWKPFESGEGDYTHKVTDYIPEKFAPTHRQIMYRTNNITSNLEFKIVNWVDLAAYSYPSTNLMFTMDEDNNCIIQEVNTQMGDDDSYAIFVSDVAEYTGNPMFYMMYPCKYYPEYGQFVFNLVYYSQGGEGLFRVVRETFQLDGEYESVWTDWTNAGTGEYTYSAFVSGTQKGLPYQTRENKIDSNIQQVKILGWGGKVFSEKGADIIIDYDTDEEFCSVAEQPCGITHPKYGPLSIASHSDGVYNADFKYFGFADMGYKILEGEYAGYWYDSGYEESFKDSSTPAIWGNWESLGAASYTYNNLLAEKTVDDLIALGRTSNMEPERTQIMVGPDWTKAFEPTLENDTILFLEYNNENDTVVYVQDTNIGFEGGSGVVWVYDAWSYLYNYKGEDPTDDDVSIFDPETKTFTLKMMYYIYDEETRTMDDETIGKCTETLKLTVAPSAVESIKVNEVKKADVFYNVAGQRVNAMTRGLFIGNNGKKYIVK